MMQCEIDAKLLQKIALMLDQHDNRTRALYKDGDRIEISAYELDMRLAMKELIRIALAYL